MQSYYQLRLALTAQSFSNGSALQEKFDDEKIWYASGKPSALVGVHSFLNELPFDSRKHFKNCFMIQVFCYHFAKLFKQGRIFVVGSGKEVTVVSTIEEFNDVDINNANWVMWVTPKLPSQILKEPELVVSLFLCDVSQNFYKLSDEFTKHILSKSVQTGKTQTNDWIEALPTNITIGFAHMQEPYGSVQSGIDDSQTAVLQMEPLVDYVRLRPFSYPKRKPTHEFLLSTDVQACVQEFRTSLAAAYGATPAPRLEFSFE